MTASDPTVPFVPVPSADQLDPFHFATLLAGAPPAVVKEPPTYRSVPENASANAVPLRPVPSADHDVPFQRATRFAVTPSIFAKLPPRYTPLASALKA